MLITSRRNVKESSFKLGVVVDYLILTNVSVAEVDHLYDIILPLGSVRDFLRTLRCNERMKLGRIR